jgi:hypothetical protein
MNRLRGADRATVLLVSVLFLAGCGAADDAPPVASVGGPAGTGTASPAADRDRLVQQYGDCMRRNGVILLEVRTEEGLPQIDKRRTPAERVGIALERCRAYLPTADAPPALSPADLEARRRHSECVRAKGVPDYPDPDPRTGEPAMSDELSRRVKDDPELQPALEACRANLPSPTSTGKVGG